MKVAKKMRQTLMFIFVFLIKSAFIIEDFCEAKGRFTKILDLERATLICNPEWCEVTIRIYYETRTTKVGDFNITLFKPANDKSYVEVEFYRWINNRFQIFAPMTFKLSTKTTIKYNRFGLKKILSEHIKPPVSWPLLVNKTYIATRVYFIAKDVPPGVPLGRYLIRAYYHPTNKLHAVLNISIWVNYKEVYVN